MDRYIYWRPVERLLSALSEETCIIFTFISSFRAARLHRPIPCLMDGSVLAYGVLYEPSPRTTAPFSVAKDRLQTKCLCPVAMCWSLSNPLKGLHRGDESTRVEAYRPQGAQETDHSAAEPSRYEVLHRGKVYASDRTGLSTALVDIVQSSGDAQTLLCESSGAVRPRRARAFFCTYICTVLCTVFRQPFVLQPPLPTDL